MSEEPIEGGLRARVVNGRLVLDDPTALPEGFVLDLVFADGRPVGISHSHRWAVVRSGRLVLNAPTELPEGAEVDLFADDEGDDLDDNERRALDDSLAESEGQEERGESIDAAEFLRELRKR